jgi:phosphate-selective porin
LGVNWYLNRNIRLMVDDNITTVKRGTLAAPTNQSQNLNVLGVRLQFAN